MAILKLSLEGDDGGNDKKEKPIYNLAVVWAGCMFQAGAVSASVFLFDNFVSVPRTVPVFRGPGPRTAQPIVPAALCCSLRIHPAARGPRSKIF